MDEQMGADSNDTPSTLTFHIRSSNSRRVLIPDTKDGQPGYWCVTHVSAGPQPDDRKLKSATEFEKVMVELRLMKPYAGSRIVAAVPIWTYGLDRLQGLVGALKRATSGGDVKPPKTWLPILK